MRVLPRRLAPPGLSKPRIVGIVLLVLVIGAVAIALLQWAGSGSLVQRAREQADFLERAMADYAAARGGYPRVADETGLIMYSAISGDGVGPDGLAGTGDDTPPDGNPDPGAVVIDASLAPGRDPLKLLDPSGAGPAPTRLVDPWGRPWRYRSGSLENENPTFDFWSIGPDGRAHTSDDIRNW